MYSYVTARRAPILAWEEERVLIERWQARRDNRALEELLLSHARLVHFWVRKVSGEPSEQEELVSEGVLGLIKAADLFDADHEVRFSTYARWWVKNSVFSACEKLRSIVDTPSGMRQSESPFRQRSLDQNDVIEGVASDEPTPEEQMIAQSSQNSLRRHIDEALKALDEIDREVLQRRNLQNPPEAVSDLAQRLGITVARLRQVERRAISRLRYQLLSHGIVTSSL